MSKNERRREPVQAEGGLWQRKKLRRALVEQYGGVRIPKEVRKTAEGVMSELMLQMWWVTPNNWLWPKDNEGGDITDDFRDGTGRTTVTPMMMWFMEQKEEVLDLILAMKNDP